MKKIKEFNGSLDVILDENSKKDLVSFRNKDRSDLLISKIHPRNNQPRKIFNEDTIEELSQSIRLHGVIQPIIVVPVDNGLYEIVAGERRWRAAKKAGLKKIPVVIRQCMESNKTILGLIENIQREDLNPLEAAQAIETLVNEHNMTHQAIAESMGKSRTAVTNLLRLLHLHVTVKEMVYAGQMEMGHARALLSLTDAQQVEMANRVVEKKLSVRETEQYVNRLNIQNMNSKSCIAAEIKNKITTWKQFLSQKLETKVNVNFFNDGKGRVVIHFNSLEKADRFMNQIALLEKEDQSE